LRANLLTSLSVFIGALAFGEATAPDPAKQAEVIAAMRGYALSYTAKLPNFLCMQITRRHYLSADAVRKHGGQTDVIEEQVNFFEHKESYQVRSFNGSPLPTSPTSA
jgi:hypothetical protein